MNNTADTAEMMIDTSWVQNPSDDAMLITDVIVLENSLKQSLLSLGTFLHLVLKRVHDFFFGANAGAA